MKNSFEISEELSNISPLLAGMEKVNVFEVPEGYFRTLGERISNLVIFNSGSDAIENKTTGQQVPEGYFESLSTNILAKIKEMYPSDAEFNELSPTLQQLKRENVFMVPSGYFDGLSGEIMGQIRKLPVGTTNEEIRGIAPTLYSLAKENVFEVPEGYFQALAGEISGKVTPAPARAKIVTMKSRRPWMRIAAAAAITGIIAITSLQIFKSSTNQDDYNTGVVSTVNIPDYIKESFQFQTEAEVNAGIARLSEDEIVRYLERNGNVMDNEQLLNNTDVSELPEQVDYLEDENTLKIYLDKIGTSSLAN